MKRLSTILAVAAVLLLPLFALGQDEPPEPERHGIFLDTVDVRVNNVEVVVTDSRGRSVIGLSRNDFRLYEDGEEVEVTNFYAVESGRRADRAARQEGDYGTAASTVPVYLAIVVDDAHLTPEGRELVFDQLREELDHFLMPQARIMVVHKDAAIEVVQPFTDDLGAVDEALDSLRGTVGSAAADRLNQKRILRLIDLGITTEGEGRGVVMEADPGDLAWADADMLLAEVENYAREQDQRLRSTVRSLGALVNGMAGLPGRKAVLYVANQLSLQPARLAYRVWEAKYGQYRGATGIGSVESELFANDASRYFTGLIADASASGVVFYSVGPAEEPAQMAISAATGGTDFLVTGVAAELELMNEEGMRMLARGTGGLALTSTMQLENLLSRIASDFQTYYSLGYVSDNPRDGERHKVRVEVTRPDLEVRYLEAFRDKSEGHRMVDKLLASLLLDEGSNPLRVDVTVGEPRKAGRNRYDLPVVVKFPFRELTLLPQADGHVGSVAIYLLVRNEDGGTSEPAAIRVPVKIGRHSFSEMIGQSGGYPAQLQVVEGRQTIAVGVRDEISGTESLHTITVQVGDS